MVENSSLFLWRFLVLFMYMQFTGSLPVSTGYLYFQRQITSRAIIQKISQKCTCVYSFLFISLKYLYEVFIFTKHRTYPAILMYTTGYIRMQLIKCKNAKQQEVIQMFYTFFILLLLFMKLPISVQSFGTVQCVVKV